MPPYRFERDTKFAAIHLCQSSHAGLPEALVLGHGLSAHASPVMVLSDMDKRRIGVDYADAYKDSIALMASMPSQTAGILDAESLALEKRAHMLLYGVLMQGVPQFWPAIITIGSKAGDGEPWANRLVIMSQFFRHPDMRLARVTPDSLHLAEAAVPGLIEVFPENNRTRDFARVRRGVNSLIAGWKAGNALDRVHLFVRALDGLMALEQNAGERLFVERTAMLADGQRIDEVAREIFRLRSLNEHLADWPRKLGYVKEADREIFVAQRAFQAEVLAGEAYRRLLSDGVLLRAFQTTAGAQVWNGTIPWAPKIDLDAHNCRFRHLPEN